MDMGVYMNGHFEGNWQKKWNLNKWLATVFKEENIYSEIAQ